MASTTQIQDFIPSSQYRFKKAQVYRLKCPWSHGRGYVVILGVVLVVLASLTVMHLHQTWAQIWQARSRRISL